VRWHLAGLVVVLSACASAPPLVFTPAAPERDSRGQFARSKSIRAAFMREHPCPSTGATSGRCDGWQVHHHVPLFCGGTDTVDNLRWIRTEDHRAFHTDRSCEP
jgi:hypothetical protein